MQKTGRTKIVKSMQDGRIPIPSGGRFYYYNADDGCRIRYAIWHHDSPQGTVFVFPGRSEFIEKYAETIATLLAKGFCVMVLDWRGQGLSCRALKSRHRHHITDFRKLEDDWLHISQEKEVKTLPEPYYILGHSMGGHLALRILAQMPSLYQKIVLSAPMIGIHYGFLNERLGRFITDLACRFGFSRSYAAGQAPYGIVYRNEAAMRLLTSDKRRFCHEHAWIDKIPDLAVGGVTYSWLRAAHQSIDRLRAEGFAEKIKTPVLVISAGKDLLVSNRDQDIFFARMQNANLIRFGDARHEILSERDEIRDRFWSCFDSFIP